MTVSGLQEVKIQLPTVPVHTTAAGTNRKHLCLALFLLQIQCENKKVPDLLQLVPLCGCNQDHLGNLTRLTSRRDAVSCFCHSQKICGTSETGPSEMYKAPSYNYNKIMHSGDCQALSHANIPFLFMKGVVCLGSSVTFTDSDGGSFLRSKGARTLCFFDVSNILLNQITV